MAGIQDDAVAKVSGSQPDRVAAMGTSGVQVPDLTDLVDKLTKSVEQQNKLQQIKAEAPTAKSGLTSLPGILSLLTAATGAATGNENLFAAGAGGVEGSIAGAEQTGQTQRASADAAIEALRQEQDQLHGRVTNLLTSQPGLFVNPMTGESVIDKRLLGYLATGEMIPIDPGANFQVQRQKYILEKKYSLGLDMMTNGDTEEERRMGAVIINESLRLGYSPEQIQAMAQQAPEIVFNNLIENPNLDPFSVLDAQQYVLENPGKSLADPDVFSLLRPKKTAGKSLTKTEADQKMLDDYSKRLRDAGPEIRSMSFADQISALYADDPGRGDQIRKYFAGVNAFMVNIDPADLMSARNAQIVKLSGTWSNMVSAGMDPATMPPFRGMGINSMDDIIRYVDDNTDSIIGNLQEKAQFDLSGVRGQKIGQLSQIMGRVGIPDPMKAAIESIDLAVKAATVNGVLDTKKFIEEADRQISEAQKAAKEGQ